ncbi:MAG: sugar transferase [Candidatus Omnitrophica bacterium]|nr:sugar transferase [Candidatus Omnitrophota bacterium]
MIREHENVIRKALAILDAAVVCAAFFLAFFLRKNFQNFYQIDLIPNIRIVADLQALSLSDYLVVLFFVVPIWCASLYLSGIYSRWRTLPVSEIILMVIKAALMTAIVFGTAAFLFKLKFVSRAFFIIFLLISFAFIIAEKLIIFYVMRFARRQGHNIRRVLVVGSGPRAAQFIRNVQEHKEWGFKVVGAVDYEETHRGKEVDETGATVIGMLEDIPRILKGYAIDEVIFIVPRSKLNLIENSLYACEIYGIRPTLAVDLFELRMAKAHQTELAGIPFITFETTVAQEWQRFVKRAFDIIVSGVGIILLSPLFLLVAVLIKLTSPGPVFFIQKRIGLNGRRFILYKFRSMYKGAHRRQSEVAHMNIMKGPVFKVKDDPRITPLGRFLRKFSIDELPQLFNVFVGHMSLVGPRALPAYEVSKLEPWQRRRLSMRPGITCLWQVSGRSKLSFEQWMKLDLEYIDRWSLWLDFKILLKTIPVVIFGIGAY